MQIFECRSSPARPRYLSHTLPFFLPMKATSCLPALCGTPYPFLHHPRRLSKFTSTNNASSFSSLLPPLRSIPIIFPSLCFFPGQIGLLTTAIDNYLSTTHSDINKQQNPSFTLSTIRPLHQRCTHTQNSHPGNIHRPGS